MCYTHTSKPPSKCSTYIIRMIFWNIFIINRKILLDAQIKQYNTKLSTRPNTYDEEHNNADTAPTIPQIPQNPTAKPSLIISSPKFSKLSNHK